MFSFTLLRFVIDENFSNTQRVFFKGSEMDSIPNGGQAILNIDRERKRNCEYEHDSFTVTKTHFAIGNRFSSDRICHVFKWKNYAIVRVRNCTTVWTGKVFNEALFD